MKQKYRYRYISGNNRHVVDEGRRPLMPLRALAKEMDIYPDRTKSGQIEWYRPLSGSGEAELPYRKNRQAVCLVCDRISGDHCGYIARYPAR